MKLSDGRIFIAVDARGGLCAGCELLGDDDACREVEERVGCYGRIFREVGKRFKVEVNNAEPKLY